MLMTSNSVSLDLNAALHMLTGSFLPDIWRNKNKKDTHLKYQHIKMGHCYLHCPYPNPSNYNYLTSVILLFSICLLYIHIYIHTFIYIYTHIYILFTSSFITPFFCLIFFLQCIIFIYFSFLILYMLLVIFLVVTLRITTNIFSLQQASLN